MQFANEGAEKKKQEEEVAARKRKIEEKEKWESESNVLSSSLPSRSPARDIFSRLYPAGHADPARWPNGALAPIASPCLAILPSCDKCLPFSSPRRTYRVLERLLKEADEEEKEERPCPRVGVSALACLPRPHRSSSGGSTSQLAYTRAASYGPCPVVSKCAIDMHPYVLI